MRNNPTSLQKVRAMRHFSERVQSLIDDGYDVQFRSCELNANFLWASLRHHNRNRVFIYAYVDRNQFVQKTNGVIVHEGALY